MRVVFDIGIATTVADIQNSQLDGCFQDVYNVGMTSDMRPGETLSSLSSTRDGRETFWIFTLLIC